MSQELHYTSVPRGLKPGSRGFCTVGQTPHMSVALADRLEALSGYQPVFPPHDASAPLNPIVFSHLRLTIAGKTMSVLSRIGPAGPDYTGRPNKYAHHVVLEGTERPEGGPAWLLSQPGFMQGTWDGEPREIPVGRAPFNGDRPPGMAHAWQALTGDGGWAGVLAESFLIDSRRTVFLIFRPGMDLLPLFVEALALLPASRRWEVDFSTYFSQLPQGVGCAWRGVLDGSADAKNARRLPNSLVLDLCQAIGQAPGGPLVHLARTGETVAEQSGGPITASGAGRHIPRIPQRPAAPFDSPAGHAGLDQPRRPSGGYDLIPELARLIPGALYHEGLPFEGDDPGAAIRRRRKRLPAVFVALCAACMIVVLGVGLFLRPDVSKEISAETTKIAEKKRMAGVEAAEKDALSKVDQEKPAESKPREADHTDRTPPSLVAKPNEPKDAVKPNTVSIGPPAFQAGDSGTITNPLFLALSEPSSSLATTPLEQNKQKPLRLDSSDDHIVEMKLLGTDDNLLVQRRTETSGAEKLVVSRAIKSVSRLVEAGGAASELATFELPPERNQVRFHWKIDASPAEKKDARRSLRDCVLEITPRRGGARYCILRGKPVAPENVSQLAAYIWKTKRKGKRDDDEMTHTSYAWDKDKSFADTSRKLSIGRCELLKANKMSHIGLERARGGPCAFFRFRQEDLLSVRLDPAAVTIILADAEPGSLNSRVASVEVDIAKAKQAEQELIKGRSSKADQPVQMEGIRTRIKQREHQLAKLQHLRDIFDSFLDVAITWEVGGLKLEISRIDLSAILERRPH
jgi:GTPase-associated protein 1, N-terminal domain type 2/GTPase-associated protein 1, middle domain